MFVWIFLAQMYGKVLINLIFDDEHNKNLKNNFKATHAKAFGFTLTSYEIDLTINNLTIETYCQ